MSDIVNRLRTNGDCLAPCLMDEAADEIVRLETALLTAWHQRDEARREVCKRVESASCLSDGEPTTTASDYARWCGWDCFKEDGKPCQ